MTSGVSDIDDEDFAVDPSEFDEKVSHLHQSY